MIVNDRIERQTVLSTAPEFDFRQHFKPGIVARLNSGSADMTITGVDPDGIVQTVWMVDGVVRRDAFHYGVLSLPRSGVGPIERFHKGEPGGSW